MTSPDDLSPIVGGSGVIGIELRIYGIAHSPNDNEIERKAFQGRRLPPNPGFYPGRTVTLYGSPYLLTTSIDSAPEHIIAYFLSYFSNSRSTLLSP